MSAAAQLGALLQMVPPITKGVKASKGRKDIGHDWDPKTSGGFQKVYLEKGRGEAAELRFSRDPSRPPVHRIPVTASLAPVPTEF